GCAKTAIGHECYRPSQNLATDRSRCTWMCGGSPRSELKKMKLYGPSRSTVGIEPHCSYTCFYTQRQDCTQKREKWLLKPNARGEPRPIAGATQERGLYAVGCSALFSLIYLGYPLFLSRFMDARHTSLPGSVPLLAASG